MKNKVVLVFVAAILAVSLVLCAACPATPETTTPPKTTTAPPKTTTAPPPKPIELKLGVLFPDNVPQSLADKAWIEKIEQETDGRVIITPYWGGTLITGKECYTEIASGACDIGALSEGYIPTGFALYKAISNFMYNIETPEVIHTVYTEIYKKYPEVQAEYADVKFLATLPSPPYQLITGDKPVRTLADLKGLIIKTPTTLRAPMIDAGADAISMSMSDVYGSLQKGTIDGAIVPFESLNSFKFAEVSKYYVGWSLCPSASMKRAMNLDSWNSLPADIQQIFEANNDFWGLEDVRQVNLADQAGIDLAKKLGGREFIYLSNEDMDTIFASMKAEAELKAAEMDAAGLPGTAIYNDIQELVAKYQS
jgi:TRAP-type C4-dicarboxylate transport system substrate-binding protein